MSKGQQICDHLLLEGATRIDLVVDAYLQPCDALMSCRRCSARYLIELCDIDGDNWCYRLALIEPEAYAKTLHSLGRGSCDLQRGQAEMFNLRHHATPLNQLLLRSGGINAALVTVPDLISIPTASWRELPCDGTLVRGLYSSGS